MRSTDGTSPAHVDSNGDPKVWNGIPLTSSENDAVQEHNAQEENPTQEQRDTAVKAAQEAFKDTYGNAAYQDATSDPKAPIANEPEPK